MKKEKVLNQKLLITGKLIFTLGIFLWILSFFYLKSVGGTIRIILINRFEFFLVYSGAVLYFLAFGKPFSKSWKFFKESSNYILTALVIFILFGLIGFAFPVFFEQEIFELMKKLVAMFEGLGLWQTIGKIFLNNLTASFFAIVLGVVFGIFPIITVVVNGYLLGFVARHTVAEKGVLVLWRLLPHGIFELPAIIFSIGMGIKLGVCLFKGNLKKNFFEAMRFFVFVILPLLLIAGVIEGVLVFYWS